jgi:ABC-type sugar transport system substrate-binding protein
MVLRTLSGNAGSSPRKASSGAPGLFRSLGLSLVILLLVTGMASAGGSSEAAEDSSMISVGIVNLPPEESGYRQANVEDMNTVFSSANGYDARQTNTGDNSEQIAAAQGYIRDGVDYLLISAANASGWDNVLQSAKTAGVTVFLFDRLIDTDESNYQAALVSDMYAQGTNTVNWLLDQGLSEYNVILIRGQLGSAAEIGRSAAVLAAEEDGDLTIVADGTGGDSWSLEEARRVVEAAITAGKDFNVIYAQNDGMAQGAVQALDAAGISHGADGDVIIIGFDFNRFALSETSRPATGTTTNSRVHARQRRYRNGSRLAKPASRFRAVSFISTNSASIPRL